MPSPATFGTEVCLVKKEFVLCDDVLRYTRRAPQGKVVEVSFLITFFGILECYTPTTDEKWKMEIEARLFPSSMRFKDFF